MSQKTGDSAGGRDRPGAGEERERRDDHLVARPDAESAERDRDRLGSVGDPDRLAHAEVGGELALERLDLGTEDEAAAVENPRDSGRDLLAQRRERLLRRKERYCHPRGP